MKKKIHILFAFFLLLSFSVQLSAKSIIFFHFSINQNELVQTVCENKDKPKSCCEAKCYLEKEIKKEEKRENELPGNIKDKSEKNEQAGFSYKLIVFLKHSHLIKFDANRIHYFFNYIPFIFHPPAA